MIENSLPPWGGSGLKSKISIKSISSLKSPSLGREWIEIVSNGSVSSLALSPSLGREWIEIDREELENDLNDVSLLGEGVD